MAFWHYDDWQAWSTDIAAWLRDHVDAGVLARFTRDAAPEWIEWLDREQTAVDGAFSCVDLLIEYVTNSFDGLRVFHLTRVNLAEVRAQGLCAWSADELRLRARIAFGSVVAAAELDLAIEAARPDHRGGRVYAFRCLRDALKADALEFARDGSEWLRAVRAELHPTPPMPAANPRTHGFLFACDLRWSLIEAGDRETVVKDALYTTLARCAPSENDDLPTRSGGVLGVPNIIPAQITALVDLDPYLAAGGEVRADSLVWAPFA